MRTDIVHRDADLALRAVWRSGEPVPGARSPLVAGGQSGETGSV